MLIDYDILPEILVQSIFFFCLYYSFYHKFIFSLVDPIIIYVIILSFSSVLILNTLNEKFSYEIHFFACHLFLLFGFSMTTLHLRKSQYSSLEKISTELSDYKVLRLVTYTLFVLYALANIVLFYTTGFALLSDEPTVAKVENFVKGYGIILKINWGVGSFLLSSVVFFILSKARRIDYLIFFFLLLFIALEGSKASLLRILVVVAFLINHPIFESRQSLIKKFSVFMPIGIIAMLIIFFVVLSKENNDLDEIMFAFVKRLLYGADATLYFYLPVNEQYFSNFHFWQFPGHLFNQVLAFFRIVPNNEAFGNIMIMNALPNTTGPIVGPNTPYYIEGQIFFGYFGAFIYSMCVGSFYAFIRYCFFNVKYHSAFWLVLACCICQQATALVFEVTLFVTQVFDTCFFVLPTYIAVSLLKNGRVLLRKPQFR